MIWLQLTLATTAEHAEAVAAQLWALGSAGAEERGREPETRILAFFENVDDVPQQARTVGEDYWEPFGASLESVEFVPDRDWTEAQRQQALPFTLGRGFMVDPREPSGREPSQAGRRRLLRVPARRAFGTGSHETTRLVVEWLEDLDLEALHVIDVGAGTGILSLVALARGAASVLAVEIDPTAAFIAGENRTLNGQRFPLIAGTVDAVAPAAEFDLVLVNVLPQSIKPHLERVSALVGRGGRAVFSGNLARDSNRMSRQLEEVGLAPRERRVLGEWEAVMAEPSSP